MALNLPGNTVSVNLVWRRHVHESSHQRALRSDGSTVDGGDLVADTCSPAREAGVLSTTPVITAPAGVRGYLPTQGPQRRHFRGRLGITHLQEALRHELIRGDTGFEQLIGADELNVALEESHVEVLQFRQRLQEDVDQHDAVTVRIGAETLDTHQWRDIGGVSWGDRVGRSSTTIATRRAGPRRGRASSIVDESHVGGEKVVRWTRAQ